MAAILLRILCLGTGRGARRGLKTREERAAEWTARQVLRGWSYHPGDYNWGMTILNLKPDSDFELAIVWRERAANACAQRACVVRRRYGCSRQP